jgi:hypothetical protein
MVVRMSFMGFRWCSFHGSPRVSIYTLLLLILSRFWPQKQGFSSDGGFALVSTLSTGSREVFSVFLEARYPWARVRFFPCFLKHAMHELQVMVFSWIGCPFCKNAKALLDSVGAKYTALELDQMGPEGTAIRAELAKYDTLSHPLYRNMYLLYYRHLSSVSTFLVQFIGMEPLGPARTFAVDTKY